MSKQREAFEAWWEHKREHLEWIFWSEEKNSSWAAWQASRAAALEEARMAVEAEHLSGESNDLRRDPSDRAYDCAVEDCIAAVKALKEQS